MTRTSKSTTNRVNADSIAWSPPNRQQHQKNAAEGKYGGTAKKINAARQKKQKMLDDLLNN